MSSLSLEGDTLGEKHKHFNKLVHNAVTNKQINLSTINYDDSDIHNLLKIHTACKTNNVDYIIKVLKCDDMLYVSTAIKHSTWLITEQAHAHIVNPEYLYTQLFPHMLTKAINKFLLHIRLHLKDEKRIEAFYNYLKNICHESESYKWLLKCSIPFIENVLANERRIPREIYKRLCKRSVKFLHYHPRVRGPKSSETLSAVLFLVKSHTEEYLNVLDTVEDYLLPWMTKSTTEIIMKKYPQRILKNFLRYTNRLNIPTVVKYLQKDDVTDFLLKCAKDEATQHLLSGFSTLTAVIDNIPESERFDFIKKTSLLRGLTSKQADEIDYTINCSVAPYTWYQYAPFNVALTKLKELIVAESSPDERCAMLSVLVTCAKNNPQCIKIVLQYYYEKHRNEAFKFKLKFINNIIEQIPTHKFESETWNILDKLFYSLKVYTKSDNSLQTCLKAITVYKILNNQTVPHIIEKKITFDTFKNLQCKLDEEQKNKLFSYLLNLISTKMSNKVVENEKDFSEAIDLVKNALTLLIDWKKDIVDYPFVLENIKNMLNVKTQNSWEADLSSLYTMNKSWRKHMFQESIKLLPSVEVYLNALKYNPQLLVHHREEINEIKINDAAVLRQLLTKLRVYWSNSLAQQWTDTYRENINDIAKQKDVIKSLFVLLTPNEITDFAKLHIPKDPKIEWEEADENVVSLQKNIASNLYVARPMVPLDIVLSYAQGDYLQHAVPSLNAILHNISRVQSRVHMSKLLEAPVALQLHGINFACMKLNSDELKPIFSHIWKTSTDATIQAHLFTHIFKMLCKVKNATVVTEIWPLLSMFIDNLPPEENVVIFSKFHKIRNVHHSVRGKFYMKGYQFLSSLPSDEKIQTYIDKLIRFAPYVMNQLDADFVINKLLTNVEKKIYIMSPFVLHGTTEENQCERFRRVLVPVLEQAFTEKKKIDNITEALIKDFLKFVFAKRIIIPVKLFSEIKSFIEAKTIPNVYYVQYTLWKLVADYVRLVEEHKTILCDKVLDKLSIWQFLSPDWLPEDAEEVWVKLHTSISPEMGPIILQHIKEDTERYFPTICYLFSEALVQMFEYWTFREIDPKMIMLKYILEKDFIPSYLVVCEFQRKLLEYAHILDAEEERLEIRKMMAAHPSQEVKMHFYGTLAQLPY